MRYCALIFFGLFASLSAATYVDTSGSTKDILTTSGDLHTYSGANLAPNVEITSIWLNFSDLSAADLSGSRLIDLGIREANLTNANFFNTNLTSSTLSGANLSGANLTKAILTRTEISKNTNFANVTLDGVISGDINYVSVEPLDTLPENYKLINGYIIGPNVNLTGANLSGLNLTGVNFAGANLKDVNLSGVEVSDTTNFSNTTLDGLISGNIHGALNTLPENYSLVNGYIVGPNVNLGGANLSSADLKGINLSGADLSYADLSDSDLTDANLSNVYLSNVDLTNALLTNVIFVEEDSSPSNILDSVELLLVSSGNYIDNGDGTISSKTSNSYKLNHIGDNKFEIVSTDENTELNSQFDLGIFMDSNSVNLTWNSITNKFYTVWHSESLDGTYKPLNNAYKIKNLNNFSLTKVNNQGFYKIKESNDNNIFGDYNDLLVLDKIDGAIVRIVEDTFYLATNEKWYSEYLDFIVLNAKDYMLIDNDGDLQFGEYSFNNVSESNVEVLLSNNTIFDKPGSKIEPYRERSYALDFSENSPLKTSISAPDPYYPDSYTDTKYNFALPSGGMPKNHKGKKIKIYIFSSSSDFCGYSEISFDSIDENIATLKLSSGDTPVNVEYEIETDSAAKLILNGTAPMLIKQYITNTEYIDDVEFTAYLNLYAKDSECGFFFGHYVTEMNPSIKNIIYGYYGENYMPVDHIYGYDIDELIMLEDQNGDGVITKVDAEIYSQNNNAYFIYPDFNFGDQVWGSTSIEVPIEDDPSIRPVSPVF